MVFLNRLFIVFVVTAVAALSAYGADSRAVSFNDGWKFSLCDTPDAARADFDDAGWRALSLPHDWAIEGDFSIDNPSGTGGGALPGGVGWYRKSFDVEPAQLKKYTYIDFDGVYMNATVYVNGHKLGTRPYGYASFSYDITPYLHAGRNVVAVRVDNAEQPNSRWYSGCGIYRNVWLRTLSDVHVPLWGQHIIAEADSARATVRVATQLAFRRKAKVSVSAALLDAAGAVVAESGAKTVSAKKNDSELTVDSEISVAKPRLWSPASPYLYTLVTKVADARGRVLDTYEQPVGFRYFEFDTRNGFSLNGRRMKINGVCLHHDAGALGAVVNRRAIERQLQIMKDMGVNAIRSSHNPPAPELLELCDRMGLMVMDETFDMWRKKKTAHDYSRYFNEWHERDMDDLIRRDRNHPSIIIWSIGNEVLEQWTDAAADTLSLEEANLILNFGHGKENLAAEGELSVNSLLTRKLADRVRSLDPTRPVTAGCNEPDPGNHLFRSGALDIIGFNYHDDWFAGVPSNFPGKPFIVTESVSGLATRGFYDMPSDSIRLWPERWDKPFFNDSFSCSSYDNCHVPWGNTHEGTMRHVRDNDFISGQFVWTGFDYIGEPTPYGWPARSSYFGIVDLAGFPKDIYYMYKSEWCPDSVVLHLLPHWNWTEGSDVDVWAYYNNADEVELFLNGESLGTRSKGRDDFHVSWRVPFSPGVLTAVSRRDGVEVARAERRTAGAPAAIRLTPDRSEIAADGTDLSYVAVEVVDSDGNLCPWADNEIAFTVSGSAFNAGVDNGSPISLERFKADTRKAFYGRALIILQNNAGASGPAVLDATAAGLRPASITINSKK
ncbi:MAG: DUF4982 domain-containing protein [Muribaculaceae bacterium]|nr:DUF4982 domain-containing protein [Muribaculaceae bacterium]